MSPRTIVVIATYNEAATIQGILEALTDYHVIVVDDSSPDGTGDLARAYAHVTVIDRPVKLGIASAYLDGLRAALDMRADYVVQMDAGGTHEPNRVISLVNTLLYTPHAYLAIGCRFGSGYPLSKRATISRVAAFLMRMLGVDVIDATSGFRAWRADLLREMDLGDIKARGFAFQLEMLWQAHRWVSKRQLANIVEVGIPYRLTNSSFRPWMIWEGLRTWARLALSR